MCFIFTPSAALADAAKAATGREDESSKRKMAYFILNAVVAGNPKHSFTKIEMLCSKKPGDARFVKVAIVKL